ncbi:hypothetical protein APHAL10511_007784 [Amanita phalloides]|nr:hypothetical protein APHAL10511_007784 [Amanita phalloides]
MLSVPPPQRPPSRSERLLRQTLRRDEEVRDSAVASPKRRHSLSRHSPRVASPPPPLPPLDFCSRPPSPAHRCRYADLADEQYTRGAFLFRSPINNGPASPTPQGYIPGNMYDHLPRQGASESSDGTATPGSRTRFHNGNGPHTSSRLSTRSISPPPTPTRSATVTRRHSLQRAFYHEPLTPQEHALRARLESAQRPQDNRRSSHMTNGNPDWVRDRNSQLQWRDSNFTARSGSMSQPQSGASILSTPPPSSPRLHSSSSPSLQDASSRTHTHTRSRSSTDPILDPSHHPYSYSTTRARTGTNTTSPTISSSSTSMSSLSPRRSAVAPQSQQVYHLHQQSRRKHVNMEATPPLTADASPTGISARNELEPDYQLDVDDDSRLITPPPSPPHFNGIPRKAHHLPHSPMPYRPMGEWYPAFTVPGSDEDTINPDTHAHTPLSPQPVRPQFNVRKASEQCKMINGYVSFVSVEGLGGPPESNSPALGDDEGDDDKRNRDKRMFGIGWDRWRKLLPLAVGGANGNAGEDEM